MAGDNVEDQQSKKRLQSFLADVLKMGSLKGFKHFAMYLRGREEMIVSVVNEPLEIDNSSLNSEAVNPIHSHVYSGRASLGSSFTSGNLPYDKQSLLLSAQMQKCLSGCDEVGVGLPPASPSERETVVGDKSTTLFLVAGYGKYTCPYVWVRSNHDRLIRMTGEKDKDKDNPLRLKSTRLWKDTDIKIWDVLAELVKLCTYPAPLNPFAIDFNYFENLQPKERLVATGAMVSLLRKMVISRNEDKIYTAKVLEDLHILTRLHFQTLRQVSQNQELPSLQQHLQGQWQEQQQRQQEDQQRLKRSRAIDTKGSYPATPQLYYARGYYARS